MDIKEKVNDAKRKNYEITNLKYEILVCPSRSIKRNMLRRLLKMCGFKKVNRHMAYYWGKDRFSTL